MVVFLLGIRAHLVDSLTPVALLIVAGFTLVAGRLDGAHATSVRGLLHTPHDVIEAIAVAEAANRQFLFAAVAHTRLQVSCDGGMSWRNLQKGLAHRSKIVGIAPSPMFSDDGTVLIGTRTDGLFKSEDSGNSWAPVETSFHLKELAIISSPPSMESQTFVAISFADGGLYISRDHGKNWVEWLDTSHRVSAIAFGIVAGRESVFVAEANLIRYKSIVSNEPWSTLPVHNRVGAVTSLASSRTSGELLVGTELGYILVTETGAQGFDERVAHLTESSVQSISISPDFDKDRTVFASTWNNATYRSLDGGKTWDLQEAGLTKDAQADTPEFHSPHFRDLITVPIQDGRYHVYLAAYDGLFRSEDGGRIWSKLETTPAGTIFGLSVSPPVDDSGDFLVSITTKGPGAYVARNSNLNWTVINEGLPGKGRNFFETIYGDVRILRKNWPRLGPIQFSTGRPPQLYSYVDEGSHFVYRSISDSTWTTTRLVLRPLGRLARAVAYLNRRGLPDWIVEALVPAEERMRLAPGPVFPDGIGMSPEADFFILTTRSRGLLRSVDGGKSFTSIPGPIDARSVVVSPTFRSDRSVYVTSASGIHKSENAGENWVRSNEGIGDHDSLEGRYRLNLAISPQYAFDRTLFAFGPSGFYRSSNQATSWARIPIAETYGSITTVATAQSARGVVLFAGTSSSGVIYSMDMGRSFSNCGPTPFNSSVRFLAVSPSFEQDGIVYAGSEELLLRSSNKCRQWKEMARPVRYENDYSHHLIQYEGDWRVVESDAFSTGSISLSESPGSSLTFRFFGDSVKLVGRIIGDVTVLVDGAVVPGQASPITEQSGKDFAISGLPNGEHRLRLVIGSGSDSSVLVDAFDVWATTTVY